MLDKASGRGPTCRTAHLAWTATCSTRPALVGLDFHAAGPLDLALGCQDLQPHGKPPAAKADTDAAGDGTPVVFDIWTSCGSSTRECLANTVRSGRTS